MNTRAKSVLLLLLLVPAFTACQRASDQEAAKTSVTTTTSDTPTTPAQEQPPGKWPVPEGMMKHFRDLEQDIQTFATATEKDHAALAAKIDQHINNVISSCTMEGKAHDALHEWLMPFRQLAKEYAAATDPTIKSQKFQAMLESFAAFHARFE